MFIKMSNITQDKNPFHRTFVIHLFGDPNLADIIILFYLIT